MSHRLSDLYTLRKEDLPRAVPVLMDAFEHDPLWNAIFADAPDREQKLLAFYETPIRHSMTYGNAFAPSPILEGIAAWVPGRHADMSLWRAIRSGSLRTGMKLGARIGKTMQQVFRGMEKDRREHMVGRRYMYLQIIGVAHRHQGKGHSGRMLRAMIERCKGSGRALYLETETERNVGMYKKFGFRLLKQITLPVVGLPMWEMVRETDGREEAPP